MATIPATCEECGRTTDLNVPDDHDGTDLYWECPEGAPSGAVDEETGNRARVAGDGCGHKNLIPGINPAEAAMADHVDAEGVVAVGDADAGAAGDVKA